jgi:acylphosphatase
VEAVLEGRADDVQRILQFCESGPARARVDHVEVSGEAPESLTGFEIR